MHEQRLNHWATAVTITIVTLLPGAGALAQSPASGGGTGNAGQSGAMAPLYACAAIANPTERLACFDGAVARLRASEASGEVIALERAQIDAVERDAFGFQVPSLPFLRRRAAPAATAEDRSAPPEEERLQSQTFEIVRVSRRDSGSLLVTSTGQSWLLTDPPVLRGSSQVPFTVRIRRATLGSYILQVEGRNQGYRVRRVD